MHLSSSTATTFVAAPANRIDLQRFTVVAVFVLLCGPAAINTRNGTVKSRKKPLLLGADNCGVSLCASIQDAHGLGKAWLAVPAGVSLFGRSAARTNQTICLDHLRSLFLGPFAKAYCAIGRALDTLRERERWPLTRAQLGHARLRNFDLARELRLGEFFPRKEGV